MTTRVDPAVLARILAAGRVDPYEAFERLERLGWHPSKRHHKSEEEELELVVGEEFPSDEDEIADAELRDRLGEEVNR